MDDHYDNGSESNEMSNVMDLHDFDATDAVAKSPGENTKYWRMQNAIKNDPAEKEHLLAVVDHYKQSTIYGFHVKQWISEKWTKPIISTITQFALFKCMHAQCRFSTNSKEDMEMHMNHHLALIHVLQSADEKLDRTIRDEQIKFRDCSYCDFHGHSNKEILDHVLAEHEQCIFQCAYCFYRSIEVDNIALHFDAHHAKEERQIYLCGKVREFREQDREVLQEDVVKVPKIECGQGKQFMIVLTFFSLSSHFLSLYLSISLSLFLIFFLSFSLLYPKPFLFHLQLIVLCSSLSCFFLSFTYRRLFSRIWYVELFQKWFAFRLSIIFTFRFRFVRRSISAH